MIRVTKAYRNVYDKYSFHNHIKHLWALKVWTFWTPIKIWNNSDNIHDQNEFGLFFAANMQYTSISVLQLWNLLEFWSTEND